MAPSLLPLTVVFEELARQGRAVTTPADYPQGLEREIVLENGETIGIRPIRPDDEPRLVALYDRLSRQTAYHRFFTVMRRLPADWIHYFANVDYRRRLALVAERETVAGVELVGVGRYERSDEDATGEVAFVLEDGYQGRGLGAALLGEVIGAGAGRGLSRFRAHVLGDNHRMLRLLANRTRIIERAVEQGVVTIVFEAR